MEPVQFWVVETSSYWRFGWMEAMTLLAIIVFAVALTRNISTRSGLSFLIMMVGLFAAIALVAVTVNEWDKGQEAALSAAIDEQFGFTGSDVDGKHFTALHRDGEPIRGRIITDGDETFVTLDRAP